VHRWKWDGLVTVMAMVMMMMHVVADAGERLGTRHGSRRRENEM
jgi:hypothetical protein